MVLAVRVAAQNWRRVRMALALRCMTSASSQQFDALLYLVRLADEWSGAGWWTVARPGDSC
jgi:hypothetical protein